MSDEPSEEDLERQKKLETDAVQNGIARLVQSLKYRRATDSKPVQDLMAIAWELLVEAILKEQLALKSSDRQKLPKYGAALLCLTAEALALITLGILFNLISQSEVDDDEMPPSVTFVSKAIGQRCYLERMFDIDRKRAVDLAKALLSRNRNRNAVRRSEDYALKFDKKDDSDDCWLHLAEKLIVLAVQSAMFNGDPVFEFKTFRDEKKAPLRIALTPAADKWLLSQDTFPVAFSPVYMPTVIPPRRWKSFSDGGYFSTPLNLLKRRRQARQWAQQQLEKADLSRVHSAVNALQNTPFRIYRPVHHLVEKALNEGLHVFNLEKFKRNDKVRARKAVLASSLSMAAEMIDVPRFYYPHQIDHRGRAYPVPQLINPQSDDAGSAQLEFADGKPLGENGAHWLAIHLANCFWKGNKVSFQTRRGWVTEHEREILAFAEDPLREHRFWHEADKPWNFLRACLEWKGYREHGPGFVSHLPISMDGTCNGYQHLSAMGLDPIGGAATNLVPGEARTRQGEASSDVHPADIYLKVAERVNRRLEKDAAGRGPDAAIARQLLGMSGANASPIGRSHQTLIDRSAVKPATMTIPYGVTRGTICAQLLKSGLLKDFDDPKTAARYLAKVLEECIPEVAVEAGKIMNWLRDIAGIYAKHNRGLVWTAPTGFVVIHEILVGKEVRARTADRSLVLYKEDKAWRINARKQIDGIVAHLVHSFDAAHMMGTVNRLYAEGLRHFAIVHDSYGVHACDVDLLNKVLREEFVRIYSEPVLQNFLNEQRAAYPYIEIPDVPQIGNLDIRQVLESQYFFA
jgi:DNA-directed RNA polymerase, mitochondrial